MRIVVVDQERWERAKNKGRALLGFSAFFGLYGVVGSVEAETMRVGTAFAISIPLIGVMLWAIDRTFNK